jgi:hypothetical protein
MSEVYLIFEANCELSVPSWWDRLRLSLGLTKSAPCRGYASVWASNRRLGPDEDYTEAARKILGPVPWREAERAIEQLKAVLTAAGLAVAVETVADD